jgi:cyclic beta-1,2-glucan synthetase
LSPCIPAAWPGFTIRYLHRGTPYVITAEPRPQNAIAQLTVDGHALKPGRNVVDLLADGAEHRVHVGWRSSAATDEAIATHS